MNETTREFSRMSDSTLRRLERKRNKTPPGEKSFALKAVLYVLVNRAWPGWVKIGFTQSPRSRLMQFNQGSPLKDYELLRVIECALYRLVESRAILSLQQAAKKTGLRSNGEWVETTVEEAKAAIIAATDAVFEEQGIEQVRFSHRDLAKPEP